MRFYNSFGLSMNLTVDRVIDQLSDNLLKAYCVDNPDVMVPKDQMIGMFEALIAFAKDMKRYVEYVETAGGGSPAASAALTDTEQDIVEAVKTGYLLALTDISATIKTGVALAEGLSDLVGTEPQFTGADLRRLLSDIATNLDNSAETIKNTPMPYPGGVDAVSK